ncbi:MAG: DUF115 domain-containing protein [Treponema sp.]|nr:DUF115 domain-containing protein [Treponema sp.]MBQ5384167.1 DUF115 domain-containing protein [Treponema sp.]
MEEDNKPRLVDTGSGFSVLYRGRLLYSKYNPARSVTSLIQKLELLPSTLVIINSPCLFYGLTDLIKKLPEGCVIFAAEDDENLFALSEGSLKKIKEENPGTDFSNVHLFSTKNLPEMDSFLRKTVNAGTIRRAVQIDFCAGKSFNPEIYKLIFSAAQEIISTFWKNRVTLVKMGRLFSKNIMKNLRCLDSDYFLSMTDRTVSKPIIVFGAGESADQCLDSSPTLLDALRGGKFFTVSVDASLTFLLDRGIKVDAVTALEPQFAIQKAYIGSGDCSSVFFADLCSRPQVQNLFKNRTVWFASEFAELNYLDKIKKIVPDFIPPLGSVGLAAAYIALRLRKDDSVPVFVTGLDFSYSIGKTHAKGSPAHKARLFSADRLNQIENIDAAFSFGASMIQGKDMKNAVTTPVMLSYRNDFASRFSGIKNIFDIGKSGLDLGLEKIPPEKAAENFTKDEGSAERFYEIFSTMRKGSGDAEKFLKDERNELLKLRDLLSNGEKSEYFEKEKGLSDQIREILIQREYLFLHFPDGYRLSIEPPFLKRVRAEIDSFLKII